MDNARIHHGPEMAELAERFGMFVHFLSISSLTLCVPGIRIVYLPPYSPDFNPIELAFSLLKHLLRRHPPSDHGDEFSVYEHLYLQVFTISAADCQAFYHHAGYL